MLVVVVILVTVILNVFLCVFYFLQMTLQFSMWDKFKEIDGMSSGSRDKLAQLICHLLLGKGLSMSVLKVICYCHEWYF